MIKKSQIRSFGVALKSLQDKKAKGYFAILGKLDGTILTGVANIVYVTTFEGQTKQVINRRTPNTPSVVFVGSDDYSANQIEVLYSLNVKGATSDGVGIGVNSVGPHSHSYPGPYTTWIYDGQFMPLNCLPIAGTLTIQVYHGAIRKTGSDGWKYIDDQTIDVSSNVPGSGACWITIQANDDGSVDYVVGSTQASRDVLDETDIPEATTGRALCAVVLEAGYQELFRNSTRNDFLDLRFDRDGGSSGTGIAPIDAEYITSKADGNLSAEVVIPGLAGSADIAGMGGAGVSYEFDSGASPLTWSVAVDVENVDSTVKSHLFVQDNGASETLGTYAWSPAAGYDLRCKVALGMELGVTSSVVAVGLIVGDSAMANRVMVLFDFDGSTEHWEVKAYTYASSTYTQRGATNLVGVSELYLRIIRDASNNNSFYYSTNGNVWNLIATQALTYTAAKAGLRLTPSSIVTSIAVDWIRSDV